LQEAALGRLAGQFERPPVGGPGGICQAASPWLIPLTLPASRKSENAKGRTADRGFDIALWFLFGHEVQPARRLEQIPKSGIRFSEKIMLKQEDRATSLF
jgi:hypothetical protein